MRTPTRLVQADHKLIDNEGVAIGETGEIIERGNYYSAIGSIFLTLVI